MISTAIQQLVNYGLDTGLILPDDEIYIRNQLLMTMQLDSFTEPEGDVCYTAAALARAMQADPFQPLWQASEPNAPYVSWVRMRHIRYICMRIRSSSPWREVRRQISHTISTVQKSAIQARRVQIYCDVDPL